MKKKGAYVKIVLEVPAGAVEETALFLVELTGRGVEVTDGEIIAYLDDGPARPEQAGMLNDFLEALRRRDPGETPALTGSEILVEEDWQRTWRAHFSALRATPRLVVRPPWEEYSPRGEERVMVIDPGMAFGTGLHASTRLVLAFIDGLFPPRQKMGSEVNFPLLCPQSTVLDVGTGTGILAMACAFLGARRVLALDNDRQAVEAAGENVRHNGLEKIVEVSGRDLAEVGGTFDLVTANIVHDTLAAMAKDLTAHLSTGGALICAGILAGAQEESLREVFESLGLTMAEARREGEWASLCLVNK